MTGITQASGFLAVVIAGRCFSAVSSSGGPAGADCCRDPGSPFGRLWAGREGNHGADSSALRLDGLAMAGRPKSGASLTESLAPHATEIVAHWLRGIKSAHRHLPLGRQGAPEARRLTINGSERYSGAHARPRGLSRCDDHTKVFSGTERVSAFNLRSRSLALSSAEYFSHSSCERRCSSCSGVRLLMHLLPCYRAARTRTLVPIPS
jgi:hypothetical protein